MPRSIYVPKDLPAWIEENITRCLETKIKSKPKDSVSTLISYENKRFFGEMNNLPRTALLEAILKSCFLSLSLSLFVFLRIFYAKSPFICARCRFLRQFHDQIFFSSFLIHLESFWFFFFSHSHQSLKNQTCGSDGSNGECFKKKNWFSLASE